MNNNLIRKSSQANITPLEAIRTIGSAKAMVRRQ
jgi:hypothetical protein